METPITRLDVVSGDSDVLVTVGTGVLVPEADHMAQFMNHDAKLVTVLSNGDGLRAASSLPYIGATPSERRESHYYLQIYIYYILYTASLVLG